ncbi:MAG: hypothetical protein ACYTEZ_14105 [Planctomycetota bacterium]
MGRYTAALAATLLCATAAPAGNDEPEPGQVTVVACEHDRTQTYACYLPRKYVASRKWPILYCFSPNANGRAFVDHYMNVCEKHGWIVVGSNNARNGPWEPIRAAMAAMWKDTQERFSINQTRCYATGWSGGSGVAFSLAADHPKHFAGVIPIAAGSGWDSVLPRVPKHVSVFFVMGDKDSAAYVKLQAEKLREKGHKAKVRIFSGGHVWPPRKTVEEGVDWLENMAPKPSVAERFRELTQLVLRSDVERKLKGAVAHAAKGNFKAALAAAERVLKSEKSTAEEQEDAAYVKEEIARRLEGMFATADKLLEEGLVFEAKALLDLIKKSAPAGEARRAQEKGKQITSDRKLRDALRAGELYNRALEYEAKGKAKKAQAVFRQIVKKHPATTYAKKAKERIE